MNTTTTKSLQTISLVQRACVKTLIRQVYRKFWQTPHIHNIVKIFDRKQRGMKGSFVVLDFSHYTSHQIKHST